MKATVTYNTFADAFKNKGCADKFTSDGLMALFDHLEEREQDIGEEMVLDVVALCCEYNEFPHVAAVRDDYSDVPEDDVLAVEWLNDRTTCIVFDTGIIISDYFN
jgi:class 3 adenylate cyclase